MLAVFATLTFLIALWLCAAVVAGTLEQGGHKIMAALEGRSVLAPASIPPIKLRVSQRCPSSRPPLRAPTGLLAAA